MYNPGQAVFGSSSPLYVLWLAMLKEIAPHAPTPALAVRMNVVFYLATSIGMLLLLRLLLGSFIVAAPVASLFAMRQDMLSVSLSGMETFLFCALLAFGLWALAARRWLTAGILAGLSVLARPEGAFLAALTLAAWLIGNRRRPLPMMAALLVPGLLWVAFGFATYGTPVYQSLVAKATPIYPLPPGWTFQKLWEKVTEWATAGVLLPGSPASVLAAILHALGVAGLLAAWRSREESLRRSGILVTILLGAFVLFYSVSNALMFTWYFPPVLLLWFLAVAAGLRGLSLYLEPWPIGPADPGHRLRAEPRYQALLRRMHIPGQ